MCAQVFRPWALVAAALAASAASCAPWHQGVDTVLAQQARRAENAGEDARAAELYALLRSRRPSETAFALAHARALARTGATDAALAALEQAVAQGGRDADRLEQEEAFAGLGADPRFAAILEAARTNASEYAAEYAAAIEPQDPRTAPSFPDLASLLAARERAGNDSAGGDGPSDDAPIRRARFREVWIAALARLAQEKSGTPEAEGALIEIVRMRSDDLPFYEFVWTEAQQAGVRHAAEAYLAEFPGGPAAREARLARAAAFGAAIQPPGFDWGVDDTPRPDCAAALPLLEALDDDGTADAWSAAVLGLKTLCLFETRPEATEEIRAGVAAYLSTPEKFENRSPYDWLLRRRLTVIGWHLDGPPPFVAEGLDGRPVSLADLRGKITLLDFWGPG
jgi:hypothetical protein